MVDTVERVWAGDVLLGEGPAWDARRGVLWFVDIKRPRVFRHDPASGETSHWPAPAEVGWVLPADDGALVAGLRTGPARFDPDTGDFAHLADVPDYPAGNRLNDATVAPDGAVWFGSMDDAEGLPTGYLHRWDGATVERTEVPPVVVTNGPAFAPDGATLYHVDTLGGAIHAVHVDPAGRTGPLREFARVAPEDGYPDGVVTDAAGNVWLGLWNGGRARLYAPDGQVLREVRLPAANVTKVALGGPDLRTAYATTAAKGLDAAALAAQPDAGALFRFPVDVPGRPLPLARIGRR